MTIVFLDSSVLIALAFNEPGAVGARRKLSGAERVLAAPLLEAEVRADSDVKSAQSTRP